MATNKGNHEPKNISEYMAQNPRNVVVDGAPKKPVTLVQNKATRDSVTKSIEEQLKESGDTVWVHNMSGAEYHIPLSNKPEDADEAIKFELNQIQSFTSEEIKNRLFKKAFLEGKLRIVKESDIDMIERMQEQAAAKEASNAYGGDGGAGLAESGLPANKKMAKRYIDDTDDLDLLESWAQKENRDNIIDYIEERIEDIENGEG